MSNKESEGNILRILYPSPFSRAERKLRRYRFQCEQNGTLPDLSNETENFFWEMRQRDRFLNEEFELLMGKNPFPHFSDGEDLAMEMTKFDFADMEDDRFILSSDKQKGSTEVRPEIYKSIFALVYAYNQASIEANHLI